MFREIFYIYLLNLDWYYSFLYGNHFRICTCMSVEFIEKFKEHLEHIFEHANFHIKIINASNELIIINL